MTNSTKPIPFIVKALLNKWREIEQMKYQDQPLATQNFRNVKSKIENSNIFQSFRTMPKGGNLHLHSFGNALFLFLNGTYRDNCYINVGSYDGKTVEGGFLFSPVKPIDSNGAKYKNVQELRANAVDKSEFDRILFESLQFSTPDLSVSDVEMWKDFNLKISRVASLTKYMPLFKDYLVEAFESFHEDNVQHIELRKLFQDIYDDNGKVYNETEILEIIYDTLDKFNEEHKANITLQFIIPSGRGASPDEVFESMKKAVHLRENGWKDKIVGFDLVDHEDRLNPLIFYLNAFKNISDYTKKNNYSPLPFYFHAGETSMYYSSADINLFDAILLNTTRIGHGLSLTHHPHLRSILRQKNILVEVSPISNQLLRFVEDLRKHPATSLISESVPISIATDDPDIYGFDTLAFEYYHIFTAWNVELETLKQISRNSILYSSLPHDLKLSQLSLHNLRWNEWIQSLL